MPWRNYDIRFTSPLDDAPLIWTTESLTQEMEVSTIENDKQVGICAENAEVVSKALLFAEWTCLPGSSGQSPVFRCRRTCSRKEKTRSLFLPNSSTTCGSQIRTSSTLRCQVGPRVSAARRVCAYTLFVSMFSLHYLLGVIDHQSWFS